MTDVRPNAVAGTFYPDRRHELETVVARLFHGVEVGASPSPAIGDAPPKAIIAPHAGYVYSGDVAASAYARLKPAAGLVRRVVLIGPCHRVALRGLAVPSVAAFATPLGRVPLDRGAIAELLTLPQVRELDLPHAEEHSLEVHLPFLQTIFERFTLIPLVAGDASAEEVAEVLERLWGGPETIIVVSSDLSHYLDYAAAQSLDASTCRAIEALDHAAIGFEQACGRVPVAGLLTLARRKGMTATTLDLRNSGDTADDRRRVVGYGAWMFTEPPPTVRAFPKQAGEASAGADFAAATRRLLDRHGAALLRLAAASVEHGLRARRPLPVDISHYPEDLRTPGACFVTLSRDGRLRGCVGSAKAYRPLVEDVAGNAYAAAFADDRFDELVAEERQTLAISLSLLSRPQPLHFDDQAGLIRQLRPGEDGLIIESAACRSLFLPQVWASLPEPREFLSQLKAKAGLAPTHWSDDFKAWRFAVQSVSSDTLPAGALWS